MSKKNNKIAGPTPAQKEEAMVVAELNTVLEKHGYAIKPYLAFPETGIFPAVKIVKVPAEESKTTK